MTERAEGSDNGAMFVLAWYWRYHTLHAVEYDSVEAAVDFLEYVSDDAAVEAVEAWSNTGYRRIDGEELSRMRYEQYRQRVERRRADEARKPPPPVVATLSIVLPGEGEAFIDEFRDEAKAEAEIAWLLPILGDRLMVKRSSPTS